MNDNQEIDNNKLNIKKNKKKILTGKRQSILSPIQSISTTSIPEQQQQQQPQLSLSSSSNKLKLNKMAPIKEIQQQKKDKKRERWLLTRKTWKYMTDAGRKLIPDNNNGRTIDDIKKCEKNFHLLCSSEPKFILWRRKASYPGAMGGSNNNNNNNSGNSKKRLKNLLTRSYKSINNNNNNNNIDNEQYNNAEQIMKILQNYLCLDDKSIKTTTLLSTKTIRPDQTISSSSKRPIKYDPLSSSISSLSLLEKQQKNANDTAKQINELLDKLRKYSEKCGNNNNNNNNNNIILNINNITPDILDNKILLKKIYNELKKQQLNRILGKYSSKSLNLSSSSHSTSLSNLLNFRNNNNNNNNKNDRLFQIDNDDNNCKRNSDNDNNIYLNRYDKNDLYNNNNNNNQNNNNDIDNNNNKKKKIINKIYIQHGTQTDFINLNELQRLSKEYIDNQQYYCGSSGGGLSPTDDDSDKSNNNNNNYNHRKSSIDNEDVSQSVSDTIKRYLRMARKKSVNDDNNNTIGNRFKRVNYDRNLRNIRSKGEIIPPGMDDGNNIKQTQTLDSWPLILLNYIKGIDNIKLLNDSHKDWENHLKLRLKNKDDYEKKFKLNNYNNNNNNNEQPQQQIPIIGSGILHSGQQFLSNLWHGHNNSGGSGGGSENSHQPSPANSTISISSAPVGYAQSGLESIFDKSKNKDLQNTMQKSKSSSNVGQFVSKKIWKTRSKSQTRTALLNYNKPDWTPQGNCVWTSANGKRLILTDTKLSDLTEIERTILHRVAIDKINQLNIGVNVTPPTDNSSTNSGIPSKSQKRRPLLIKRKAVTTSFFDSGKNKNDKELSNSLMFGVTLEKCLENDQRMCKDSARSSKNSISSLINDPKGIGSCDSLVTKSIGNLPNSNHSDRVTISGAIGTGVSNLINAATMKLSRSQSDIRRNSQQDYDNLINSNGILGDIQSPPMTGLNRNNGGQKIPAVVISCIKHIEENGLHTVGIFRVSTSKKRVRQLKDDFDRGDVNILDPEICPHDVATLLKEYFRELPEPLLCINLYKAFVKTQKIRNRRLQLEALSHLVQLLPVAHRDTLYILLKFLAKIVRYSDDVTSRDGTILSQGNKMDSNNLATVFAPNILRQIQTTTILSSSSNNNTGIQHNTTEQEIDEQLDVINVIRTMIDHFEELFKIPAELMDEIYTNMLDTFPQQLDYLCQKRDIKNDDEMDSASSNTPLSSPPPILGLNQDGNIQQIFNKFTTTSDNNNQKLIKTNIVTPPTLRRIYSRQVVMHENAAKGDNQNENNNNIIDINDGGGGGGGSGSVSSGARRRDRTSKMKYISSDNENDILRRRRRDRLLSGDGCLNDNKRSLSNTLTNDYHSMAKDDESFTQSNKNNQSSILRCLSNDSSSSSSSLPIQKQQQQQQQQQQLDRRLSTPNVLQHNTGVVTATLKIPLQMQQQQTIIDHGLYNHGKLDLSDIPYIEDCTNGQDFGSLSSTGRHHFAPIIGSISFSGNTQLELNSNNNNNNNNNELLSKTQSFQIPIKYDGKILNSAVTTLSPPSGSFQQLPQTNKMNKSNINNSNNNNNNNNNNDNINNKQKYHIEPKITPSITSIGGDVLRSKTADFERILTQNKKYKSNDILLDNNNSNNNNNNNSDKLIIQPIQHSSSTSIIIEGSNNVPIQKQQQQQQFKNNTHKNGSQGQIYKRQELISSAKRTNK